jgi:hypothetical protein
MTGVLWVMGGFRLYYATLKFYAWNRVGFMFRPLAAIRFRFRVLKIKRKASLNWNDFPLLRHTPYIIASLSFCIFVLSLFNGKHQLVAWVLF